MPSVAGFPAGLLVTEADSYQDPWMPCYRCRRVQTDPGKGQAPWARGVVGSEQVLVCPQCQRADPTWVNELDRCAHCESTRLSLVMGSVVCRDCGEDEPLDGRD